MSTRPSRLLLAIDLLLDIFDVDRPATLVIAAERLRRFLVTQHADETARQIHGIVDATVEAESTERIVDVRREQRLRQERSAPFEKSPPAAGEHDKYYDERWGMRPILERRFATVPESIRCLMPPRAIDQRLMTPSLAA